MLHRIRQPSIANGIPREATETAAGSFSGIGWGLWYQPNLYSSREARVYDSRVGPGVPLNSFLNISWSSAQNGAVADVELFASDAISEIAEQAEHELCCPRPTPARHLGWTNTDQRAERR